ncbi:PEGA domain-containing protein [Sorangium atrum]|uniref:PEGA domain-containing protein n=1 Tax=Sorangium atrum TaxID=2995308 RepID=A0ABT5C2T6_9BACT|nr:PEGA domain-containing protein [Sorangium aterium]MDC0680716.1 PEGA domain-containing protein [Sorangium aterium]
MMMNCRSLAVLFSAATLIAVPEIAAAQTATPQAAPANADAVTRADESYRRGLRLYSDKKYVEAEAELQSAWELNPTFDVAYNLGNTKYQLKKYREAAEHLSFALRNWPLVKTVAKLKPTAEQRFAESRAQVGALRVTVSVAGAEVLVDGKAVGRAPLEGEVFVEPGEHRVEARLEGYAPLSQTVKSAKGETADVGMALVPEKSEAQAAGAKTEGGMGAAGVGAGGPVMGQPPAGPVEPPPKKNWVPVIALGAASAVGLGVGIGMTVASNNASGDAHTQSTAIIEAGAQCVRPEASWVGPCEKVRSDASRADTLGNVARVAYIASGVLAIGAVTYALWPKSKRTEPVLALPVVHSSGAGLAVMGAW